MKKVKLVTAIISLVSLAACGGGDVKKVVVMASGKFAVNGDAINFEPGTQHNEAEIEIKSGKITVSSSQGSKDYAVNEPGVYLLNLQNDTLIGSIQNFGSGGGESKITQEILIARMDSLKQLTTGANVSAAKKNYFIPPAVLQKITSDKNAIVRGPYRGIPASIEPVDGKAPEVYKFITNKDARETLGRLETMLKQQ
jgi:hypothetical protein